MPSAYFDSGAFDHLYRKKGCTASDIANLRKRIYGRELSVALSIQTLSEILLDRRSRPEQRVARTKFVLSIGSFRRMIKPAGQLLVENIRAYADSGEPSRPYLDAQLQNVLSDGIGELIETDGEELDEDMMDALRSAARKAPISSFPSPNPPDSPDTSWIDYLHREAPRLSQAYANFARVSATDASREITGLLSLPDVSLSIRMSLWGAYYKRRVEIAHPVCASRCADVLVTTDDTIWRCFGDGIGQQSRCASLAEFLHDL